MCSNALQAKYEHAMAAAQKSISQHSDRSDDEEEDEEEEEDGDDGDGDAGKKKTKQKDSLTAAEKVQQAAELVEAVLKAQRKLQQLQAGCCCCCSL